MIPLTLAVELLAENAGMLAAVAVIVRFARAYQTELTWTEYRVIHQVKRVALPVIKELSGGVVLLVSQKGGRDDDEYLTTTDAGYREVVRALRKAGGTLHLINSIKQRPDTHGDQLSAAHLVWTHADGKQTEVYLFRNSDGTTDIYAHVETGVTDPLGHLTDPQQDGDVRDILDGVELPSGKPVTSANTKVCATIPHTYETRLRPAARLGRAV